MNDWEKARDEAADSFIVDFIDEDGYSTMPGADQSFKAGADFGRSYEQKRAEVLVETLRRAKQEYWNRCYVHLGNVKAMTINGFDAFVDEALAAYSEGRKP